MVECALWRIYVPDSLETDCENIIEDIEQVLDPYEATAWELRQYLSSVLDVGLRHVRVERNTNVYAVDVNKIALEVRVKFRLQPEGPGSLFTDEWLQSFREVFYPLDTLSDHLQNLAILIAEVGSDLTFVEGYGPMVWQDQRTAELWVYGSPKGEILAGTIGVEIVSRTEYDDEAEATLL